MTQALVLTIIGPDRPGLVEALSSTISAHQGNWLESSMSQLAGQFAGILRVDVAAPQRAALEAALMALPNLHITLAAGQAPETSPSYTRELQLELTGHDRVGIVREVAQILARHQVNVDQLQTGCESAPMSGEAMFHATARLMAGPALDTRALKRDLEQISDDLMVDIHLGETIS